MTQYLDMAAQKTGGLLSLAVRLMQVESEVNIDCTTVATILGVLFQIRDDYMNLKSDLVCIVTFPLLRSYANINQPSVHR